MVSEHRLSERHACRLVGLSRDSYRHPPQADQATVELHEKIVEIAHVRRRFGYRRIHDLLDSIHSRTLRSYQHRRRPFGSLNGRGIRCAYLALVAHVLMVVSVLPMRAASCSMNRIRGRAAGGATGGNEGAMQTGANPSATACATGLGALFDRAGRDESPVRATGDELGTGVSQASALARADAVGGGASSAAT